jgi:hypothetical protein
MSGQTLNVGSNVLSVFPTAVLSLTQLVELWYDAAAAAVTVAKLE